MLPKGAVDVVVDPTTHKRILVYRKKGEKKQDAVKRVKAKHNITSESEGSGEPKEAQTPKKEIE